MVSSQELELDNGADGGYHPVGREEVSSGAIAKHPNPDNLHSYS
jgi:hypothetical protein